MAFAHVLLMVPAFFGGQFQSLDHVAPRTISPAGSNTADDKNDAVQSVFMSTTVHPLVNASSSALSSCRYARPSRLWMTGVCSMKTVQAADL